MNKQHNKIFWPFQIIVIGLTLWIMIEGYEASAIRFDKIEIEKIQALFVTLAVITFLIERSVEVLVALLRGTENIEFETKIKLKTDEIKEIDSAHNSVTEKKKELRELEKQLILYKSKTKEFSHKISFFIGLSVSAAGVRTLGGLGITPTSELTAHFSLFSFIDTILTAGLLAGGSDGVHQLALVYNYYFKSLAKAAKKSD